MPRRLISELKPQEQVDQTFRAVDKQLRANRQGAKYIILKLADRSGTLTGMLWNADDDVFNTFQRGDFLRCVGRLQVFNGGLQMIVSQLEKVDSASLEPADFERFDASAADAMESQLRTVIAGLTDPLLRAVGLAFIDDEGFMTKLKKGAAAVNHHHAYPGGLLRHTIDLMELAQLIAPRYPRVNGELVILGAFLHDLGKTEELSVGEETVYTDRGQLIGHIIIGVQMLADKIREAEQQLGESFPEVLRWQLEHLVLSHHGQLEFGSPKIPLTVEAILLHHIDNLDAKMAAADAVLETDVAAEGNWTNFNPAFGRKLWKQP